AHDLQVMLTRWLYAFSGPSLIASGSNCSRNADAVLVWVCSNFMAMGLCPCRLRYQCRRAAAKDWKFLYRSPYSVETCSNALRAVMVLCSSSKRSMNASILSAHVGMGMASGWLSRLPYLRTWSFWANVSPARLSMDGRLFKVTDAAA